MQGAVNSAGCSSRRARSPAYEQPIPARDATSTKHMVHLAVRALALALCRSVSADGYPSGSNCGSNRLTTSGARGCRREGREEAAAGPFGGPRSQVGAATRLREEQLHAGEDCHEQQHDDQGAAETHAVVLDLILHPCLAYSAARELWVS